MGVCHVAVDMLLSEMTIYYWMCLQKVDLMHAD